MFSKQKLKTCLREWLKIQLAVPMDRGMSLKDDADGVSVYVDSVEEPIEGTILLGLSIVKGDHPPQREELTLRILRARRKHPKETREPPSPIAGDLQVIDDETS